MERFTFTDLPLDGLKKVERRVLADQRGFLSRLFCADSLAAAGWPGAIAQINHARTEVPGTVRGLHYQKAPHLEAKLVSCIRGRVWDVVVDMRESSPTFLCWHAETLSAANHTALLIPEGFAHGFQCLEPSSELLYCHSTAYAPEAETGLHPMDCALAIPWPLEVKSLSARDAGFPSIRDTQTDLHS